MLSFVAFQIGDQIVLENWVETTENNALEDANCSTVNVFEDTDSEDNFVESETVFTDWKDSVHSESIKNESEKVLAKTDGLMGHVHHEVVIDNIDDVVITKDNECNGEVIIASRDADIIDDSADDSSDDTDSEDEYMPDGELVRKNSRGFKQLVYCKKFWLASQMVGK